MSPKEKSAADAVLDSDKKSEGSVAVIADPATEKPGVIRVTLKHIKAVKECKDLRSDPDADKSFETLKTSIKQFGIFNPLLVEKAEDNGSYNLIGGYRRFAAAKELDLVDVPVVIVDAAAQAEAVGKLLGRARPTPEMVRQIIGIVDNTARQSLGELDILAQIEWLIATDNDGNFKRGGSINATALAKALGTGYEYMRNRVHVLENFDKKQITDIQAAIDQGRAEKGSLPLNWSKVWASLRRGGLALESLKRLIWGGGQDEDESKDDSKEAKKAKKAQREIISLKRGVPNQSLDDSGIVVKLIGAPGSKNFEAEVTIRTRMKGSSFAQERGNENITSIFDGVVESIGEFKKETKSKEVLNSLREAFDSTMSKLKAQLSAK